MGTEPTSGRVSSSDASQVALNWFLDTLVESGVCSLVNPKWGNYQFHSTEVDHETLRRWMQESVEGAAKWAEAQR